MKKRIISFLVCSFFAVFSAATVYAHSGDVFQGGYVFNNQKDLKVRITQSAQTSFFNSYVYNGALDWNNISSNVHVSVIMEVAGMPSIANSVNVYDDNNKMNEYKMGQIFHYDRYGNEVDKDSDWYYATININTDSIAYNELPASQRSDGARMCFIHEVGHVLKLAHPQEGSHNSGHNFANLLPYAVMNTGLPIKYSDRRYDQVAWTVTDHDKSCLRGKWGN